MECPFLTGKFMFSCTAKKEVYVPSAFEIDEYCKTDRYKICPHYCKRESAERFNYCSDGSRYY